MEEARKENWRGKKRSFDLVEATAHKAVDHHSFEIVPPEPARPTELPFTLQPAPKIITFDCYGTLVQWYEVLLHELGRTLADHGRADIDASVVLDDFSTLAKRMTA